MGNGDAEPVVVLGAGLIGLAVAFELTRRGRRVRVFDAREPARAASWAGAGMLAPFTEGEGHADFDALCERSLARYPAFVSALEAASGIDAQLHLGGILEIAYDAAALERLAARERRLRARGVAALVLGRAELRAHEPIVPGRALGALLCEAEGWVDNRRLGRALLAACETLGVSIEAGAENVALECDGRRALGIRGPRGFVPAQAVINACGAWASELAGVPARARVEVTPVKGQMLALATPRNLLRRCTWVPGAYLVPRDDGRLLVGATVEAAGYDVRVTASGVRALLDAALNAVPALGDLTVAETWAGLRPGTPDGLPYLGETEVNGYYVASGHYRNGILLAPETATLIADALEGRPVPAAFSPRRSRVGSDSGVAKPTA